MKSNNGYSFFFLGLGIGAAVGMLFAPKSGADTRNYLQSKAGDTAEQLKQQGSKAMDMANEGIGRAKAMFQDQANKVQSAVDEGKRAYNETVKA